jgi:hypothetical protein
LNTFSGIRRMKLSASSESRSMSFDTPILFVQFKGAKHWKLVPCRVSDAVPVWFLISQERNFFEPN